MKGFKKLLTGILAATMIMGASLTAFAAEDTTPETVSITIENDLEEGADGVKKIDYTYYQFLKAEVLELDNDDAEQEGKAVYYVEDEDLATALANTNLFTSTKAQAANRWYIAAVKGVTADQIVAALNTPDMKKLAISTDTFSSDENRKAVKDGLEPGYYLVLSSLGTKAALQTLGDVVIKEKNEDTTVTKTENKNIDAMFDHEVEYTITINVPESPAEQPIMVVDTATVGLTLDETVKVNGEDYDWAKWTKGEEKVNSETQKSEIEYTLSIPKEVVIDNAGGAIVLTYGAQINERAKVYVEEENRAYIVYDNNKSAETVPVKVKTLGIKIIKYTTAEDKSEKRLPGAEFTLWRADKDGNQTQVALVKEKLADGNDGYRVAKSGDTTVEHIVVDDNGEALVAGLDADYMYYLQEEVAPEGYTMLSERFPVEMDTNKTAYQEVKVENKSGVTLPSTGGIGTTIFYIVGGILIVAGIAYFIVRRKANAQ
ncbi:MAG: SpaH/EbpB family LPXTG-anchored major pilin [Butyrivibrio sp.]|nr:SpaH/EbpB family LPXTG-anchored major pilin [Butyrivibrio sp.]MBP3280659.1 SpaH/EbpB family LPXTG-anchored major pilin [Butyrivibrio sp.]